MYEFIEVKCNPCNGLGKHTSDNEFPCWNCRGHGKIKRNIIPLEDVFTEGSLKYETAQFECEQCEKEWHLGDTYEAETGDYEKDLYKCTCGAMLSLSGEWVSEYYIDVKLFKGIEGT